MRARSLLAVAAVALVGACAAPVAGNGRVEAPPTIDGVRLEQDVRDYLRSDPSLAPLAGGSVQCPRSAVIDPTVILFCQITGVGRVWSVPVTVLDGDGDYRIDKPF
jgi:hypothetical protein